MRCEDFLANREGHSRWRRWRANCHARSCPACATAARVSDGLRQELNHTKPLPVALREMWVRAAGEPISIPPRSARRRPWKVAAIVGILLVIMIGLMASSSWRPSDSKREVVVETGGVSKRGQPALLPEVPVGGSHESSDLLVRFDALHHEIQAAIQQAELLDARRQADEMITTYSRW